MSSTDTQLVAIIEAAAEAAVQRSLLTTITPIYRHGILTDLDLDTYIHQVQMDGDSDSIPVHDITQLSPNLGDRVTVLFAPPHQAMIIGLPIHDLWHVVGDPNEPDFATGWANEGGTVPLDQNNNGFTSFRHWGNLVELRGFAHRSSGSGTTVYTLPEGYRPRNLLITPGAGALAAYNPIQITQTGLVQSLGGGDAIFDGIFFSVV